MRNRAFRPIAAILSILILTGVPAHAAPIAIREVIQMLGNYQNPPQIQLRSVSQNSSMVASGVKGSLQTGASGQSASESTLGALDASPIEGNSDSLLAGVSVASDPQTTIEVIDTGDVDGTVCDCGEIEVAGGGFPKWPLLFLAAIPLFFIHGCDDCDTPTSTTPTSTPTPPGVPEPASLFLFGTGLAAFGAGLRRRYAKAKLIAQMQATEEE